MMARMSAWCSFVGADHLVTPLVCGGILLAPTASTRGTSLGEPCVHVREEGIGVCECMHVCVWCTCTIERERMCTHHTQRSSMHERGAVSYMRKARCTDLTCTHGYKKAFKFNSISHQRHETHAPVAWSVAALPWSHPMLSVLLCVGEEEQTANTSHNTNAVL